MPVFFFHSMNDVAKKLTEMTGSHGFIYTNRAEMELRLQRMLGEAGYDIDPRCHTIVGPVGNPIDTLVQFNLDDELDRHAAKLIKQKSYWFYVKLLNGSDMKFVIGYCSSGSGTPFNMGSVEMAQKGLLQTSHIPRPL